LLAATTAVSLIDPGALQRTLAALHAATRTPSLAPVSSMAGFDTASFRGPATVLLVLAALILLATAVWCIVAWGAFRQSFATPRWRAWLATSIWIMLLAAIVWLPLQLA